MLQSSKCIQQDLFSTNLIVTRKMSTSQQFDRTCIEERFICLQKEHSRLFDMFCPALVYSKRLMLRQYYQYCHSKILCDIKVSCMNVINIVILFWKRFWIHSVLLFLKLQTILKKKLKLNRSKQVWRIKKTKNKRDNVSWIGS